MSSPLGPRLRPCGPVLDAAAAERTRETLQPTADAAGWAGMLEQAWPALAPVFAASPYLAGLARRAPRRLRQVLESGPDARLSAILAQAAGPIASDRIRSTLRELKAEVHLLTALADLGGVWDLDQVTGALARFADAAAAAALAAAAAEEVGRGRLAASLPDDSAGCASGLFVLALGKHGAGELNYSSDIDVSVFYDPARLPVRSSAEPAAVALRMTQTMASILQQRTEDGYVFRVDLRLRPDPSSNPAAMPAAAALDYYESVGQNWERAAMIKARPCAGDLAAAEVFVEALQPFIWRRRLDYAAIADIHAIKRQIHAYKTDERLTAPGANLKLGRGGIREIEFFVQTQQLIGGGRDPSLRSPRTLDALAALAVAGWVDGETCAELTAAYRRLRALEHRVQMVADEQTHVLPEADADRRRPAALAGEGDLPTFDADVSGLLTRVNARYAELFAEDEPLSSRFGSLVFTGVEDDPETLATLSRLGFSRPAEVAAAIRAWHHGRIGATRTERGRELFTRLAPRLLEALHETGAPDTAFIRFADFFSRLSSGVQVQSLFLAEPALLAMTVEILAFAPSLAVTLARQPAALDALIDPGFLDPLDPAEIGEAVTVAASGAAGFEAAMDAARRAHREAAFRIGVQIMTGRASAARSSAAFTALADTCLGALALFALAEAERQGGTFPGEVAVVALGKTGSREMSARSDLDLMTVYAAAPGAASAGRGWSAETFYARFTQRLVAALSAPTGEGGLYQVDLQLRPSGTAGPVAVSLPALERYYAGEAETWELLALTRARVVWSTSDLFGEAVRRGIEQALRRPRNLARAATDVAEMRALMARERPPWGEWDLKLGPGGLVDIEFAAQFLQLAGAAEGGPLAQNTGEALAALAAEAPARSAPLEPLCDAWTLQQALNQVLRLALPDRADPSAEPLAFQALLARVVGAEDMEGLQATLQRKQAAAHDALGAVLRGACDGSLQAAR